MKTFIGVGALFVSSLVFTADAKAGNFDWFCRCPCPPQPECPPATASVQGTTGYSATYQPRAVRAEKRWKTYEDYRREIKGW